MSTNRQSRFLHLGMTLPFLLSLAACSSSDEGGLPARTGTPGVVPTVLSTSPADGGTGVALNSSASVTFSEAMDPASLTGATFTMTTGTTPVTGTVICANSRATFWPTAHFASGTTYTAKVMTGAKSAAGMALAMAHTWTFTTGTTVAAGLPVDLGTAGTYAILAKSAISTVPASAITGHLGLSPAAATYITGFSLSADSTNVFSTSTQVTGKVYAANYAVPTPSNLTTAVGDMQLAFTDAAGRAADVTELGSGSIGGMVLLPKVYKWGSSVLIGSDLTLNGSATDVWIFQIAQNLTLNSGVAIHLTGGALAKNVFWQVAGAVDLGTTAHCEGIVLTYTAANLRTGASINGRLLAQTAVSLDGSTVVAPAP